MEDVFTQKVFNSDNLFIDSKARNAQVTLVKRTQMKKKQFKETLISD